MCAHAIGIAWGVLKLHNGFSYLLLWLLLMDVSFFAHSLESMEKLPNSEIYDGFAYHVALLKDFSPDGGEGLMSGSTVGRRRSSRSKKSRKSGFKMGGGAVMTDSNASNHSASSSRSLGARNTSRNGPRNSTVDGGNLFAGFRKTGSFRENSSVHSSR
jgi:hypothetical protein